MSRTAKRADDLRPEYHIRVLPQARRAGRTAAASRRVVKARKHKTP